MTTMVANTFNWIGFSSVFNWFKKLEAQLEHNRKANQTIKELSKLTDRELNDIGISRGDIYAVAHYENNYKIASDAREEARANANLKGWV